MALFTECMLSCAQNLIDTADIVREAIYRQSKIAGERREVKQSVADPAASYQSKPESSVQNALNPVAPRTAGTAVAW